MQDISQPRFWLSAAALACFACTALVYGPFNSWLEQQRVVELMLGGLALALLPGNTLHISPRAGLLLILLFGFGLVSSLSARYPLWALHEWSKSLGLFSVVLICAEFGRSPRFVRWVLFVAGCVVLVLALQFLLFYLAAYTTGKHDLSPWVLYPGFDNPRFYAQALIMLCPVALVAGPAVPLHWQVLWGALLRTAHVIQWALLIALAGRGSWLAVTASITLLFVFSKTSRPLLLRYATDVGLGLLLFGGMFYLLPWLAGIDAILPSGLRYGLSAREVLWDKAWQMTLNHPLLGVGPLHFSAEWNHIAAHPHQVFLQWSAEWGLPAALLLFGLCLWGLWRGLLFIAHSNQAEDIDSVLWLTAASAFILAQVDGVFVMPYSEGWLAIFCGLALVRWNNGDSWSLMGWSWPSRVLFVIALIFIAFILIYEVPRLYEIQTHFWAIEKVGSPPRFWDQGWIPMQLAQ